MIALKGYLFLKNADKDEVKPIKKTFILVFFHLVLLATVLSHQACSNIKFELLESSPSQKLSGGNGTGYDGKLTYYHFVPGFTCDGKSAPQSTIQQINDQFVFTESTFEMCGARQENIKSTDIHFSKDQNFVVGFNGDIFEKKENGTNVFVDVPNRLVEAWCFAKSNDQSIEILINYDSQLKRAEKTTLIKNLSTGAVTETVDNSIARTIFDIAVMYKSSGFDLTIDKKIPVPSQLGLFQGQLKTSQFNSNQFSIADCYLGGDFDARIWPGKMIADSNVMQMKLLKSSNSLVLLEKSLSANQFGKIVKIDSNSQKNVLSPLGTGAGVLDFKSSPDENFLVYRSSLGTTTQLFSVNVNSGITNQINHTLTNSNQKTESDYFITSDSNSVIYKDGSHDATSDVESWLRKSRLDGSQISQQINPDLPLIGDYGVYSYLSFSNLNTVVYLTGPISNDDTKLYATNTVTKSTVDITPALPAQWFIPFNYPIYKISEDDTILIIAQKKDLISSGYLLLKLKIDGTLLKELEIAGSFPQFLGPSTALSRSKPAHIIDLKSFAKTEFSFANQDLFKIDQSGSQIIHWSPSKRQLTLRSLLIGSDSDLCSDLIKSNQLDLGKYLELTDSNNWYFAMASSNQPQVVRLLKYSVLSKNCVLVNSVIIQNNFNVSIEISSDKKFAFLKTFNSAQPTTSTILNLISVPLDGKVPREIVSEMKGNIFQYNEHIYVPDLETLYLKVKEITSGNMKVFQLKSH